MPPYEYVQVLRKIVEKEKVDLVIPNTYAEVTALAGCQGSKELPGMLGAGTYLPMAKDIRLCQDKWTFWRWCREECLLHHLPKSASFPDGLTSTALAFRRIGVDEENGLAWLRARRGAGAYAATKVRGVSEAIEWMGYHMGHRDMQPQDFMLSEYLPGRDIIVSMVWRHGRLVWLRSFEKCGYFEGSCRPSGTSSTGIVDKAFYDESHFELCRYIVSTLNPHAHGNWTLDWKQDAEGDWKLTECNIGRFIQGTLLFNRIPEQRDWLDAYLKAYSGWDFMDEPVWYDNTGWFTVRSVNRGLYLGKEEGLADLKRIAETN
uniref:ATP-grasp domain-containing protein n=1 Tax=viral metagenome TaxID=1070528 RepID=A0A6M3K384_9ZZZZ